MSKHPLILAVSIAAIAGTSVSLHAEGVTEAQYKKLQQQVAELTAEVHALKLASSSASAPAKKTKAASGKGAAVASSQPSAKGEANAELNSSVGDLKDSSGDLQLKKISDAFDVPESPAAGVLGVSASKVQHIQTPKQLIATAINGLDDHGHFQTGTAIDFSPGQYLLGDRPARDFRYTPPAHQGDSLWTQENIHTWFLRTAARTQISFASIKGTTDSDKSSKIALGIHSVLVNGDDALGNASAAQTEDDFVLTPRGRPLDHYGRSLNEYVRVTNAGSNTFLNAMYDHAAWAVGAAPEWIAPDDNSGYNYAGTTAWSSFSYKPTRAGGSTDSKDTAEPASFQDWFRDTQFIVDTIYHNDQTVMPSDSSAAASAKGGSIKEDSLLVIGGLRFGTRDFNATATAAYMNIHEHGIGSDSAYRFTLSAEKRISSNSWLTIAVSKDAGNSLDKNATLVLGGVKIGLGGRDFTITEQKTRAQEFKAQ